MTAALEADALAALVQGAQVDSTIYTDPDIYALEQERVFRQGWVYVAHESEIPEPGDYVTDVVGGEPIILTRTVDGEVTAVANRCQHRGTELCPQERGRATTFTCIYHGWKYRNSGELLGATFPDAYGPGFDKHAFDLPRVPRVASYRGFVFVSLAADGPPLDEHLGDLARREIDHFCDLSPVGRIRVAGGVLKYSYRGNWKVTVENTVDAYHAMFVHRRWLGVVQEHRRAQGAESPLMPLTRSLGHGHSMIDFDEMRQHLAELTGQVLPVDYDNEVLALRPLDAEAADDPLLPALTPEEEDAYVAAMTAAHGPERARELMVRNGTHVGLFPNLALVSASIRKVRPISVGLTEVRVQAGLLEGVPDAMNVQRLRGVEDFWGAAGQGHPDDVEVWERIDRGFRSRLGTRVDFSRGLHRERVDADGSVVAAASDEVPQREILAHWAAVVGGSRR